MGIKVLSLFDGIGCGRLALKELDIDVEVYYASEIDKHAIKCATTNHPDIIEIGDITLIDFNEYIGKVDLIIGGSPCQGFSVSGKQLAFLDERSALIKYFFDAVRIIQPKWFMLENVVMQKVYERNISNILGVNTVRINAALVSPQQRIRLYWTNIPNVTQPVQIPDLTIESLFKYDVLRDSFPEGDIHYLKPEIYENQNVCYCYGHTGPKNNQSTRLYHVKGKHPTISLNNKHRFLLNGVWKCFNINGYEMLQGLPWDYTACVGMGGGNVREPLVGNGWCIPVIKHIFKGLKGGGTQYDVHG